jgi:hypothetical protein
MAWFQKTQIKTTKGTKFRESMKTFRPFDTALIRSGKEPGTMFFFSGFRDFRGFIF